MYDSNKVAAAVKQMAASKNIVVKVMLEDLGLGSNTMSGMYHGKNIAFDSLARMADYLDCSVDYLLGRTDISSVEGSDAAQEERRFLAAYREAPQPIKDIIDTALRPYIEKGGDCE